MNRRGVGRRLTCREMRVSTLRQRANQQFGSVALTNYNEFMTTTVTATFDGKVLIPSGEVDLPRGIVLRLQVELEPLAENSAESLGNDPACGIWADRTDLGDTSSAARHLRRRVEKREDHAK